MRTQLFLFIAFCFVLLSQASASESADLVWDDFKSPITTDAKYVLYTGSVLTIGLAIFEDQTSDPLQAETIEHRPLGKLASNAGKLAGNLIPNLAYTAGMFGYAVMTKDRKQRDRGNLMARATIYAQGVTTALKHIVREPRPDGSGEKVSFPSGHATTVFSFATVVATEHAWYWGALAYSYAALVAYGRMNDNRHLLHDVLGGATIGASYGLSLYLRNHRNRAETSSSQPQSQFLLYPADRLNGLGVSFISDF